MTYLKYMARRLLFGAGKADFVHYPLFVKPADLKLHGDFAQHPGIRRVIDKLRDGTYVRNRNPCLCGNTDVSLDELISRLDVHAIDLDVLLCRKCGLIRSADAFDARSNADYYRQEYRTIFSGGSGRVEEYFTSQLERGTRFLGILQRTGVIDEVESVMEIGCGSGGVLYPLHSAGKRVSGYDYDEDYLAYGRSKGMEMFCLEKSAGARAQVPPDLLILSHVVEHFLDLRKELTECIAKVRPGKYLLIEVPGIFCASTRQALHGYPVRYLQIAHVFQFFYRAYLEVFYKAFGLEVIHGDETATFVLRKPLHWEPTVPGDIFSAELSRYPPLIDAYLKEAFFDYRHRPDRENILWFCSSMLERLGLRKTIKRWVRRQATGKVG